MIEKEKELYLWFYQNLNLYEWVTPRAKKLKKKILALKIAGNTEAGDEAFARLEEYYKEFVSMFELNPFYYESGLRAKDIASESLDAYIINLRGRQLPIGYYRKSRPVEGVLYQERFLDQCEANASVILKKRAEYWSKMSDLIVAARETVAKKERASLFRALVMTLAMVAVCRWVIYFFITINIIQIVFNWNSAGALIMQGLEQIPLLSCAGMMAVKLIIAINVILLLVVGINIPSLVREYAQLAKDNTAKGYAIKAKHYKDEQMPLIAQGFSNLHLHLMNEVRRGSGPSIKKGKFTKQVWLLNAYFEKGGFAFKYLENPEKNKRGIRGKSALIILCTAALLLQVVYGNMIPQSTLEELQNYQYESAVAADNEDLRSKKLRIVNAEECPVYRDLLKEENVDGCLYTIPNGMVVELVQTEESNDVYYCKIKKITKERTIEGWVAASDLLPYNYINYDAFEEIPVTAVEASSVLASITGPEKAVDWNRNTEWQEGSEGAGEDQWIRLYFAQEERLKTIQVFPGNASSIENYTKNGRVKEAQLWFSNGEVVSYVFDDIFDESYQTIWLNKEVITSSLGIKVLSVYPGTEFQDLCIAEIHGYKEK